MIDQFSAAAFGAGDFFARCPGGIGGAGGPAALDATCRQAAAAGARNGILVMLLFFAWGALHYYFAAATLPRNLGPHSKLDTADRGG
jgi:hypothetical protein